MKSVMCKSTLWNCLLAGLVLLGAALPVEAGVVIDTNPLVEWDIAGSRGASAEVLYSASGVSASSVGSHGVKMWNEKWGYKGFMAATHWEKKSTPHKNKYFQFDVTADEGYSIDYSTISFSLFRGDYKNNKHGAEIWSLQASTDGFKKDIVDLASLDISSSRSDEQVFFDSLDISSLGLKDQTVSFRLYGAADNYNNDYSGLGNTNQYGFKGQGSNLQLGGKVVNNQAVPEPATLIVLGLGGVTVLLRRRKKLC